MILWQIKLYFIVSNKMATNGNVLMQKLRENFKLKINNRTVNICIKFQFTKSTNFCINTMLVAVFLLEHNV